MIACLRAIAGMVLLVLAVRLAAAAPADAGIPPEPPETSAQSLERLAVTIEDEAKRRELLANIRALIEAERRASEPPKAPTLGEQLTKAAAETAEATEQTLRELADSLRQRSALDDWLRQLAADEATRRRGVQLLSRLLAILGVGWLGKYVVWQLLMRQRQKLVGSDGLGAGKRLVIVAARIALQMLPILAFFGLSYAVFLVLRPAAPVGAIAAQFLIAYATARATVSIARELFAPAAPALRLLPVSAETGRVLLRWVRCFVFVAVFGYFLVQAAQLFGLPERGYGGLLRLLGVALTGLMIAFITRNRRRVADWLRQRADAAPAAKRWPSLLRSFAAVWHLLAIVYVIGVFVTWAVPITGGFSFMMRGTAMSLAIVVVAMVGLHLLKRLADRCRAWTKAARTPEQIRLGQRAGRYLPPVLTVIRVAIFAATAAAILNVWGVPVATWLQTGPAQRLVNFAVSVAVVLAVALAVWEAAGTAIETYLDEIPADGHPRRPERSARAKTLLPLLRKALFLFLSVMVVMITLSELGLNIGPLIAGAGVVGLAIGFGSQKLVQDVITGFFILVEDSIAAGDIVSVAGVNGAVEEISIRSLRLRDLSGNVHTVPFSAVTTVTNMTKDFSYYLLDIGVDYNEDTDRVTEVCRQIVVDMLGDPQFAPFILDPLEVMGVDQFADSAVIIKARIKTRPTKQWLIGREFNRRMKKRFDEFGIRIPFPHRTVVIAGERRGPEPVATTAVNAAPPERSVAADAQPMEEKRRADPGSAPGLGTTRDDDR
jgi:small conductance mechanosensitive channel